MCAERTPKVSMKSTWRRQARSEWTFSHWFYELLGIHPEDLDEEAPVHLKTEAVPYTPDWSLHRWVITHAVTPLLIQHVYIQIAGHNLGTLGAILLYSTAFQLINIHQFRVLRRLGYIHGFFDGYRHARDSVPDAGVAKVASFLISATIRPIFTVSLAYHTSQAPISMRFAWLPLEIGFYGIILDFWYYWYHRLLHSVGLLWKYHRTHHLSTHPNPLLTTYGDFGQEAFDIVVIPLVAYFTMKLMGMPMGFYEWWFCGQYVVLTEVAGHSGVRLQATAPSTFSFLLRYFNAELVIEDHDLHHRKGKKKCYNYGKQTRLWDRMFGTYCDRIESVENNVDYINQSPMPLY
ncbi:Fatty acid hydroxylase vlmA [Penicillium canescens]|nr:Fatty acid hydroxylase vlmA [Penicillium canescens]